MDREEQIYYWKVAEYNELIAHFLGFEKFGNGGSVGIMFKIWGDETCDLEDLRFHESWDWLMLVVKKILYKEPFTDDETDRILGIKSALGNAEIEPLYELVVEFIKNHNTK